MTMMLRALFPLLLLWTTALQAAPAFPPLSGRVVDEAALMSRKQAHQLTQQLAAAIEPLRDQPIAEASKPAPTPKRPARAPQQPGPKIPMVGPTPGGGEVLHF